MMDSGEMVTGRARWLDSLPKKVDDDGAVT